jgi:F-type H+-transporting ATPase subunit b
MIDINATFFAQVVSFVIFILLIRKYIWPRLDDAISTRRKFIFEQLEKSEKINNELSEIKKRKSIILQEAQLQAETIITNATERSKIIRQEAQKLAAEETKKIKAKAFLQASTIINKEKNRARDQALELVSQACSEVFKRSLTSKEKIEILRSVIEKI